MPAVVSDLDAVPTKGESEKPQNKPVAKCPFDHSKPAEDIAEELAVETNGNEKIG